MTNEQQSETTESAPLVRAAAIKLLQNDVAKLVATIDELVTELAGVKAAAGRVELILNRIAIGLGYAGNQGE